LLSDAEQNSFTRRRFYQSNHFETMLRKNEGWVKRIARFAFVYVYSIENDEL